MRGAPSFLEGGGGEIAPIGTGDDGPEMEAVGVIDAVQAGDVDEGFLGGRVDVGGY